MGCENNDPHACKKRCEPGRLYCSKSHVASSEEIKEGGSGAGALTACHPEAEGSLEASGGSAWTLDSCGHGSPVCLLGHDEWPRTEANTVSVSHLLWWSDGQ